MTKVTSHKPIFAAYHDWSFNFQECTFSLLCKVENLDTDRRGYAICTKLIDKIKFTPIILNFFFLNKWQSLTWILSTKFLNTLRKNSIKPIRKLFLSAHCKPLQVTWKPFAFTLFISYILAVADKYLSMYIYIFRNTKIWQYLYKSISYIGKIIGKCNRMTEYIVKWYMNVNSTL